MTSYDLFEYIKYKNKVPQEVFEEIVEFISYYDENIMSDYLEEYCYDEGICFECGTRLETRQFREPIEIGELGTIVTNEPYCPNCGE